jgi:hypothetical protein
MRFAKPPTEVPLDDGTRYGTEPWREIDGVSFYHYDRWLLRLSLDEPEGLNSIIAEFRRRTRRPGRTDDVAEAMVAQLADLASRLASVGRVPKDVLDNVERESTWLRNKAFRRIWHAKSLRRTEAMTRTPRNVLEGRARKGNWSAFPVSPRPYYARLHAIYRDGYADYRAVGSVVLLMQLEGERMVAAATSDDERLAVRRAIVGAAIEAMAHVDDSGDELGQHFRDEEQGYLTLVRHYLERPGILRDLLELATWEDYGLFHHLDSFLSQLPEPAADLAVRELARIISEVRGAALEYQRAKAKQLRGIVLRSAALLAADWEEVTDGG